MTSSFRFSINDTFFCDFQTLCWKGTITGLELDKSELSLAKLYLAAIQALAYGTKSIVDQLMKHGHQIDQVAICGGLAKSSLFIQTHADVLNLRVIQPLESESVLLGTVFENYSKCRI